MIIHYIAKCTYWFITYGVANSSGNTLKNNVDVCLWNLLDGKISAHEEAWVYVYLYVLFFSVGGG